MAEDRAAHAELRGDRAAEIGGEQDRAEHGGARPGVERGADEAKKAEPAGEADARRQAELAGGLDHDIERDQPDAAVEEHEEDDEAAEDAPGPERGAGLHPPRTSAMPSVTPAPPLAAR